MTNPSPYMYLLNLPGDDMATPGASIVGSSPEALVKLTGDEAMLHPIAGTRPRGQTPEEDADLVADLLADPKERAEHLMLVDLGRNDLGRVCRPGTVNVVEFMRVEQYSHVHHIVSTVVGRLQDGVSAYDLLAATFPAGTLSGAPKPRAMEIIDELESIRRGLYAGCIGYFDFAGDMDTAIAIRTALLRDGQAYVQAGAGIVADSDRADRGLGVPEQGRCGPAGPGNRQGHGMTSRTAALGLTVAGGAVVFLLAGESAALGPGLLAALLALAAIWLASGLTRVVIGAGRGRALGRGAGPGRRCARPRLGVWSDSRERS